MFSSVFKIPSNILFALFSVYTWGVDLLTIDGANNFTNCYLFISLLAVSLNVKWGRGVPKYLMGNFQSRHLSILHINYDFL